MSDHPDGPPPDVTTPPAPPDAPAPPRNTAPPGTTAPPSGAGASSLPPALPLPASPAPPPPSPPALAPPSPAPPSPLSSVPLSPAPALSMAAPPAPPVSDSRLSDPPVSDSPLSDSPSSVSPSSDPPSSDPPSPDLQSHAPASPSPASSVPPSPSTGGPVLVTRRLTKRYGSLLALDNLDLELERGDVFGFIGPNGAGKSTTMKICAGLLDPTGGTAHVLGKDVTRNGDFVRRNVGYMPDFIGVYEDLTVTEYLDFFASAYGLPRRVRRKTVADVLELTDLNYKQDALVDSLSRGMTQRLSLARVLVHDPPLLLLDEPASGLDPRARIEMRELLKELQRLGKTIIISSHILSELGEFCNKLGIVERGKLLVVGTIDDLMRRARAHPAVCIRVVGDPKPAEAAMRRDPRVSEIALRQGELHVTLADPTLHHHFLIDLLSAAGMQIDSITPEQLRLEDVFLRLTKGLVQ